MDLIDSEGNSLSKSKSKQEVEDILATLAPKNADEERILATQLAKHIEWARKKSINKNLDTGFNGVFKENAEKRSKTDGFSESRNYRQIAAIPMEMVYVAQKIWGDDVLTNPEKFKEAFVKDEQGQLCLTVDPKTI